MDRRCDAAKQGQPCKCGKGLLPTHLRSRAAAYKLCGQVLMDWISGGVCMCCDAELGRGWCLDHDHATGFSRGVVCRRCNIAATYFEDPGYRALVTAYVSGGLPEVRRLPGSVFQNKDGAWIASLEMPCGANGNRLRWQGKGSTREVVERKLLAARQRKAALIAVKFGSSLLTAPAE